MVSKKLPTLERLNELLSYDFETGVFRWKKAASRRIKVGAIAGTEGNRGYRLIRIYGTRYLAHRLAWKMHYGNDPKDQIDHINGVKTDNRIENLRECTHTENMRNRGKNKVNKSGYKGVHFNKCRGKYKAEIYLIGKKMYLGRYDTAEEAHEAYKKAAKKYHGYFYNGGEK